MSTLIVDGPYPYAGVAKLVFDTVLSIPFGLACNLGLVFLSALLQRSLLHFKADEAVPGALPRHVSALSDRLIAFLAPYAARVRFRMPRGTRVTHFYAIFWVCFLYTTRDCALAESYVKMAAWIAAGVVSASILVILSEAWGIRQAATCCPPSLVPAAAAIHLPSFPLAARWTSVHRWLET